MWPTKYWRNQSCGAFVAKFTFTPTVVYEYPKPGSSMILFQIVAINDGDISFGEIAHEGGSAEIDAMEGLLEYVIGQLVPIELCSPGWFVIEGYYGAFHRDHDGEVDCNHSYDRFRTAEEVDLIYFGFDANLMD